MFVFDKVLENVDLIFDNALKYFDSLSQTYGDANRLKKYFHNHINELVTDLFSRD